MTTTTEKLANSLRTLINNVGANQTWEMRQHALDALAAYDAQNIQDMTTTTERIDVLAVMDRSASALDCDGDFPATAELLREARSAVVELIEFRAEIQRIAGDYVPDRDSEAPLALTEMRAALDTALARVGAP